MKIHQVSLLFCTAFAEVILHEALLPTALEQLLKENQ